MAYYDKHPGAILRYIQLHHPITLEQLRKYRKGLNWELLINNEKLPWSFAMMEEFEEELCIPPGEMEYNAGDEDYVPGKFYPGIDTNKSIPWSVAMIDRFIDRISWNSFTHNWPLEKNVTLFERYATYLDLSTLAYSWKLPWTYDLVKRHEDRWGYFYLTARVIFDVPDPEPELMELLDEKAPEIIDQSTRHCPRYQEPPSEKRKEELRYKEKLKEKPRPLQGDDLLYALEHFSMRELSDSDLVPWSPALLEYLIDREDFNEIFTWNDAPLTEELLDLYADRLEFGHRDEDGAIIYGVSSNSQLPWSTRLLKKYEDRWDWFQLSTNNAIPVNKEMLHAFIDKWQWYEVCIEQGNLWNLDTLQTFYEYIDFYPLSMNKNFIPTPGILEAFGQEWEDVSLYDNELFENEVFAEQVLQPLVTEKNVAHFLQKVPR